MDLTRLKHGDRVVIVGTSGFAVELAGLLRDIGVEVRGCVGPEAPSQAADLAYLGGDDGITDWFDTPMVVAIGQPELRRRLFERITAAGGRVAGFIHPAAYVSSMASIAEGTLVYPNATVHAGVTLARGVLVNSNATIGHETSVGAFVNIGPGVSLGGRVRIGNGVYVGIGACTIEGVTVAAGTVLSAGAVVVRDCIPAGTYIGVPARRKTS
jgi:sugar O-acyltransferase (sialic acid O-acetyltransferase NeuD family)